MELKIRFSKIAKACPKCLAGAMITTMACVMLNSKPVQAAAITVPKGYTISRVRKADAGTISQKEYNRLVKASIKGMTENDYTSNDQRIVRPGKLSTHDQIELTKETDAFRRICRIQ